MDSISAACYAIGIITFSLESVHTCYEYDGMEGENEEQMEQQLSAFVYALEILSDILEDLKIWPQKPINPLPPDLETAAQACESDLHGLEQQLRELRQPTKRLELGKEEVQKLIATLQSHIKSLWPYAASLSSCGETKHTPETAGCKAGDLEVYENIATSENSIRNLFNEDQNIHPLNMYRGISNYMKTLLQRLNDGGLTYSRPQLYQLQNLVKEASQVSYKLYREERDMEYLAMWEQDTDEQDKTKQNTAEQDTGEENIDDKKIDHGWLRTMLIGCIGQLSNLGGIRVTVSPSAEAYETIVALKLLIVALQKLSDRVQYNRADSNGKRKAETEDEGEKSGCAKRMKVTFQLNVWHRTACKRPAGPHHICGRAAEDEDEDGYGYKYSEGAGDRYPRERSGIHRKHRNSTALHRAAENGLEAVVQLLLKDGADFEAKDFHKWTALHRAAANGCVAAVRLLLEYGADIAAKTASGSTALHQAAYNGQEAVVRLLLEKGADIGVKDDNESTAISKAAEYPQYGVMKLLIEHGANIDGTTQRVKWRLLNLLPRAAQNGIESVARQLLQQGPDVEAEDKRSAEAIKGIINDALLEALKNGHKVIVQLLLEHGVNLEAKDWNGRTILLHASYNGWESAIQPLLELGAYVGATNANGWTALHYAAKFGRKVTAQLLLDHSADIEAKGPRGWTALILAARHGHEAVTQLLVERGASIEVKGSDGWTARDSAAQAEHWAVVRLLT